MDDPDRTPVAVDYLAAYAAVRGRLVRLTRTDSADTPVPACPSWRVRDVLAHLAGLCEDWVNHRLNDYASQRWTADHVSRHDGSTCEEMFDAWGDAMVSFTNLRGGFLGLPPARWAFGDAVVHEADVRGAIGAGRIPDDAVLLSLHGTMQRWKHILSGAGAPPLRVRSPDGPEWWLGGRDDPDGIVLEAPLYELFRGLCGRRSRGQAMGWAWSADPEAILAAGLPYPFTWASNAMFD